MSEETTTSEKVAEIIETIGGLTVLELADLVKALKRISLAYPLPRPL